MQRICFPLFILFLFVAHTGIAQSSWLFSETLDRSSNWNHPYYQNYTTADKRIFKQTDSAIYCSDCNMSALLWKGIESNKIIAYQLDKTAALVIQKPTILKKKLLAFLRTDDFFDALHQADITLFRRETVNNINQIKDLTIEWISVNIHIHETDFIFYVKTKDAFAFLKNNACYWVHPYNLHNTATFPEALIQHNYIEKNYAAVSAYNLQPAKTFTLSSIPLLQKLVNVSQPFYANPENTKSDTLLVYLKAMCSADIKQKLNRGYYKVQLPSLLLKLFAEKKISGYAFHEAGYFTNLTVAQMKERMVIEQKEDGDYTMKHMDDNSLTTIHILKTERKSTSATTVQNEWILLGMGTDVSTDFTNTYVIAFPFDEVTRLLSTFPAMWYNGTNETDSMNLAEALRTQRIAYSSMHITNIYADTIVTVTNDVSYQQKKSDDVLASLYYEQCEALLTDLDATHKRIIRPGKDKIESFELHYAFSNLSNNADIAGAIIEGIKTNKLTTYKDSGLREAVSSSQVLNLLDKARFYKTGNTKKDSIYISKLPFVQRYIQPAQLTEYTLNTTYKTLNNKNNNTATSIGILIPAELNPQYEQETFCYVSYPALIKYLSYSKTAKKYISQLKSLSNENAIIEVLDFYGIQRYPLPNGDTTLPNDLPAFVRERVK